MNKKIKIFFIIYFNTVFANAQPAVQWQHCFGGSSQEFCSDIIMTKDNGYAICSGAASLDGDILNQHGNGTSFDIWVLRLDSNKNIIWNKCYGSISFEGATSINQTYDGGFIIAGINEFAGGDVTVNHGANDAWIIKVDSDGVIQWQKSFGGSLGDFAFYSEQTYDGGYIVACYSGSNDFDVLVNYGGYDYWILKLDSAGNIVWQKTYGGSLNEKVRTIKPTLDGGYIIAGNTYSNDSDVTNYHGGEDIWIVKIDSIGNMQWQKTYGGSSDDRVYNIYPLPNGEFAFAAITSSIDFDVTNMQGLCDYWFVKIDSSGNIIWQKTYGGSNWDVLFHSIPTLNKGFILAGETASTDGDVTQNHVPMEVWLVQIDSVGNIIWQNTYGGSSSDAPTGGRCIVKNSNNNYVIACTTFSNDGDVSGSHGPCDVWMFELNNTTGLQVTQTSKNRLNIFPNPSKGIINLRKETIFSKCEIKIYNSIGLMVLQKQFENQHKELQLDLSNYGKGIYLVKVSEGNNEFTQKVVVE